MPLECTLNALWVSLVIVAVGSAFRAARKRTFCYHSKRAQVLCALFAVIALFPYISSSDDAVRLEHAPTHHQSGPTDTGRSHDNLIRLYETLDTPLATYVYRLTLTLFTLAIVTVSSVEVLDRAVPFVAGRSPPVSSTPAIP